MTRIVTIASYPKSGNTWTRLVIEALRAPDPTALDINAVSAGEQWVSDRGLFERTHAIDPDWLTEDEILRLRPAVIRALAAGADPEVIYLKGHDANLAVVDDHLYPRGLPLRCVYPVRHPFDIAVSFAHHGAMDIDQAIDFMTDPAAMMGDYRPARHARGRRNHAQLPQYCRDWSTNVASFLDAPPGPLLVLRYEDMLADPWAAASRIAGFLHLDDTPAHVRDAVSATRFDRLAAQEARDGFREMPLGIGRFFRGGRAGDGDRILSGPQKHRLARAHGTIMERLGYGHDRVSWKEYDA